MRETLQWPAVDSDPQAVFAGRFPAGVFVFGFLFGLPAAVIIGAIGNSERWFA